MSGELAVRRVYEADEYDALQRKVQRLEGDLRRSNELLEEAERQLTTAQRVLTRLRKQLEPQYLTMKALFGDLEEVGIPADSVTSNGQPIPAERYSAWKARLSPTCGKIIDALLVQPMNHSQLITYCKAHYETVRVGLQTLKENSLIEQGDGKKWRLKQ